MIERVFVIETLSDARALLAHLERSRIDLATCVLVGLDPAARALLHRSNVPSVGTLDYFDNDAHARTAYHVQELVASIDRDLRFELADDLGEAYVNWFVDHARVYTQYVLKILEVLDGIRRAHPASTIVAFSMPQSPVREPKSLHPHIGPEEHFVAALASAFFRRHGNPVELIAPPAPLRQATSFPDSSAVRRRAPGLDRVRSLARALMRRYIAGCYVKALKAQRDSKPVLAASPFHRIDSLLLSIQARFPQALPVVLEFGRRSWKAELRSALSWWLWGALRRGQSGQLRRVPLNLLREGLAMGPRAEDLQSFQAGVHGFLSRNGDRFTYLGVSYLEVFRAKVEAGLIEDLALLRAQARVQDLVLRHLCPSLVLTHGCVRDLHSLALLSQGLGIPAMVVPIKSVGKPTSPLQAIGQEMTGRTMVSDAFPYVAAQSPAMLSYLEHVRYKGRAVPTGPLIWSRLKGQHRCQADPGAASGLAGSVIVYAPTMHRLAQIYVCETLDEVLSSMSDLVEIVEGWPEVHLILRLHPSGALRRVDVETLIRLPSNVTIDDSGRQHFPEVLAMADLLVTSNTTAFEEAVQNEVPAIQYDKWMRYNYFDSPLAPDGMPPGLLPAYYAPTKERLESTLRWILENPEYMARIPPAVKSHYVLGLDAERNFYELVGRLVGSTPDGK